SATAGSGKRISFIPLHGAGQRQATEDQVRHYSYTFGHQRHNCLGVATGEYHCRVIPQQSPGDTQLLLDKAGQHQPTTAFHRLGSVHAGTGVNKIPGGLVFIANQPGVLQQRRAQELAARSDEPTEVAALIINQITGHRGAEIDDYAGPPGQRVACHQSQPSIHAQSLIVRVAIADTIQRPCRKCNQRPSLKPAGKLIHDQLRFIRGSYTDQPASMDFTLLTTQQLLEFDQVGRHVPIADTPSTVHQSPFDECVAAVELENHRSSLRLTSPPCSDTSPLSVSSRSAPRASTP